MEEFNEKAFYGRVPKKQKDNNEEDNKMSPRSREIIIVKNQI